MRELVGFHQVEPGEELVGRIDTHQRLAGNIEKIGKARACADENGVKMLLLNQVMDGVSGTDEGIGDEMHT